LAAYRDHDPAVGALVNDALERFARDFPAGTVLFEEGQPGHDMYIVVAGEIEIRRRLGAAERVLAVLGDGEFFGEMAILSGRTRSATAVVRSAARLLVIDGTTFEAMLRARPEIALRLIKALAARLEATNQHVELLLLPTPNHRVVQCLRHMADEQLQLAASQAVAPLLAAGTAIFVPRRAADIAARVGLPVDEVDEVIDQLRAAYLVLRAQDVGVSGDGFVVPEVGRLLEFLELASFETRSTG
jgi:CRP-like cAMP-binding protein